MTITVPRGNAGDQGVIADEGYSVFQHEEMKRRVEDSNFDFVCATYDGMNGQGRVRSLGPVYFTYYTKDDRLHVVRIGQKKVLSEGSV